MDRFRLLNGRNSGAKEIDLRYELSNMFYGSNQEVPKAYQVLVRYIRLDANGAKIKCHCNVAHEGSVNPRCSICLGEGWLWDEKLIDTFKYEKVDFETRFYFLYDIDLLHIDRVVEFDNDKNGDPIERRATVWSVTKIEEKRSDNGRVEFVLAHCSNISRIYTTSRRRYEPRT